MLATATFNGLGETTKQTYKTSAKKQKKSDKKSKENKPALKEEKSYNKSQPNLGGKFTHNRQLSQIKCIPFIKESKQKPKPAAGEGHVRGKSMGQNGSLTRLEEK